MFFCFFFLILLSLSSSSGRRHHPLNIFKTEYYGSSEWTHLPKDFEQNKGIVFFSERCKTKRCGADVAVIKQKKMSILFVLWPPFRSTSSQLVRSKYSRNSSFQLNRASGIRRQTTFQAILQEFHSQS